MVSEQGFAVVVATFTSTSQMRFNISHSIL